MPREIDAIVARWGRRTRTSAIRRPAKCVAAMHAWLPLEQWQALGTLRT